MNKPLREKPRPRKKKPQEAPPDDAVQGLTKDLSDLWQRFFQEQYTTFEQAAEPQDQTAFFTEDQNADMLNRWQQFIRDEMTRCFQVTPIGPLRQYQEKTGRFLAALAAWEASCQAFVALMCRPLSQSLAGMTERIRGQHNQDIQAEKLFPLWIQILEDRYMTLYRSAEFIAALHEAVRAVAALSKARDEMLEDILKSVHVPSSRDMDELYQELYTLRKRVADLERTVKERHGRR
jgi:polyhydroxyalkanoate synthesis regulator phasin